MKKESFSFIFILFLHLTILWYNVLYCSAEMDTCIVCIKRWYSQDCAVPYKILHNNYHLLHPLGELNCVNQATPLSPASNILFCLAQFCLTISLDKILYVLTGIYCKAFNITACIHLCMLFAVLLRMSESCETTAGTIQRDCIDIHSYSGANNSLATKTHS